jgi:hypothetical protein
MGRTARVVTLAVVLCLEGTALAQTVIKPPKNKFTPAQDVEYGLQAAAEVRKQYPVIKDEAIAGYLSELGNRLVAVAPAELNKPEFKYSFTPVNVKEINAFALPGGPMFVNRGMFDAAKTEGEVVGVMAHELSHVLLRHGTANVTKSQNPWLQLGQIAGQVGGAMVGGGYGSMIAQGSQFGLGAMLLRYSRDYEKQADLLGAQLMAKAGYDPRDLAHMFETIEAETKGGGNPQWLSSHPNPGNRTVYITKEAESLTIGPAPDVSQFQPMKARFAALPKGKSMAEVEKGTAGSASGDETPHAVGTVGQPIPAPSSQFKTFSAGKIFQASTPDNWTPLPEKTSVKVVPQNGYGDLNGQTVFTHGVEFGIAKASSRDLTEATRAFLQQIAQSNPELKLAGQQQNVQMSGRTALAVPLVNSSPLGGQEQIVLATTFLVDGNLFYFVSVAPEKDAQALQETFRRIFQSIKLTDAK